jgi:leucyl-tRNA synthetase
VNYKLRDWLFARQCYWGGPIPVIFLDDSGETVPLDETELDDFSPTGTGEPPLAKAVSWGIQIVTLLLHTLLSRYNGNWMPFYHFFGIGTNVDGLPKSHY